MKIDKQKVKQFLTEKSLIPSRVSNPACHGSTTWATTTATTKGVVSIFRPTELESQQSRDGGSSSKEDSFEYPEDGDDANSDNNNVDNETSTTTTAAAASQTTTNATKRNNADQFLVCVFNVSSKVSYSILQVSEPIE